MDQADRDRNRHLLEGLFSRGRAKPGYGIEMAFRVCDPTASEEHQSWIELKIDDLEELPTQETIAALSDQCRGILVTLTGKYYKLGGKFKLTYLQITKDKH